MVTALYCCLNNNLRVIFHEKWNALLSTPEVEWEWPLMWCTRNLLTNSCTLPYLVMLVHSRDDYELNGYNVTGSARIMWTFMLCLNVRMPWLFVVWFCWWCLMNNALYCPLGRRLGLMRDNVQQSYFDFNIEIQHSNSLDIKQTRDLGHCFSLPGCHWRGNLAVQHEDSRYFILRVVKRHWPLNVY